MAVNKFGGLSMDTWAFIREKNIGLSYTKNMLESYSTMEELFWEVHGVDSMQIRLFKPL